MPKSKLDLRRLQRALAAAPSTRPSGVAPGGRPATGLMDAVRENLDALVELNASGQTWNAIAAALSEQNFTTADGRPITGTNLTGIISSIRRQKQRQAAREAKRAGRTDLARRRERPATGNGGAGLAPELQGRQPSRATDGALTEEEIRRDLATRHQHLFKKDDTP